jgi:hypothetical protein
MQGLSARPTAAIGCLLARCGLAALVLAVAMSADAQAPAAVKPAAKAASAPAQRVESRPTWSELTPDQQQALKPLASPWSGMAEAHKRKWIALSGNYRAMPPADQAKLHSRMTEWASLSPQQRTQARLNFAEAKGVPLDERKAKWEAYQALSPEEKRKLAARAPAKTPPTAAAVRPVPSQRLANVPRHSGDVKSPRIAAGPAPTHVTPAPSPIPAVQPSGAVPVQAPAAAALPAATPAPLPVAPVQPVTQEN